MDVKFGDYVTYQSNEYKAIRTGDQIEILSENPEDQFKGFIKYSDNVYTKTLALNEISAANRVQTIAKYKGRNFYYLVLVVIFHWLLLHQILMITNY